MKVIRNKHQLVQVMIKMEWTQKGLGALLDLTTRQIRRYVTGDAPIPRTVELSINWLIRECK